MERRRTPAKWQKTVSLWKKKAGKWGERATTVQKEYERYTKRISPYLEHKRWGNSRRRCSSQLQHNRVVLKRTVQKHGRRSCSHNSSYEATMLFLKEQLNTSDVFLKRTVETQQKSSGKTRTVSKRTGLRRAEKICGAKPVKNRGLYRPVSLVCGSKRSNEKQAAKGAVFPR